MRLLRLQEVATGSMDRVFRHSQMRALIAWLAGFAATAAFFFGATFFFGVGFLVDFSLTDFLGFAAFFLVFFLAAIGAVYHLRPPWESTVKCPYNLS